MTPVNMVARRRRLADKAPSAPFLFGAKKPAIKVCCFIISTITY